MGYQTSLPPVLVVDEPVVEDTIHFMHPEPGKLVSFGQVGAWNQQYPPDHPGEVSQIEDIVGLGGCGQEGTHGSLVDLHGSLHHHLRRGQSDTR